MKKQNNAEKILKKKDAEKETVKINFNYSKILSAAVIIILIYACVWYLTKPDWSVSNTGIINYNIPGVVNYEKNFVEETDNDKIYKIIFESRDTKIYGLLRIPKNNSGKLPGVVILPGAGVSKDGETKTPEALSKMGYITLTIDQRDVGETKKNNKEPYSAGADYERFKNNTEPITYKMIFDVISAHNLMKNFDETDSSKVTIIGISNGGRMAIIAAAIDPGIKTVIGISTAGYAIGNNGNSEDDRIKFYKSIDPDNYISLISPGKVVMIHSKNDPGMPIESAKRTFSSAKEPKEFIEVSCNLHGYCDEMEQHLENELKEIFK